MCGGLSRSADQRRRGWRSPSAGRGGGGRSVEAGDADERGVPVADQFVRSWSVRRARGQLRRPSAMPEWKRWSRTDAGAYRPGRSATLGLVAEGLPPGAGIVGATARARRADLGTSQSGRVSRTTAGGRGRESDPAAAAERRMTALVGEATDSAPAEGGARGRGRAQFNLALRRSDALQGEGDESARAVARSRCRLAGWLADGDGDTRPTATRWRCDGRYRVWRLDHSHRLAAARLVVVEGARSE
jgi:hypothetical protein